MTQREIQFAQADILIRDSFQIVNVEEVNVAEALYL